MNRRNRFSPFLAAGIFASAAYLGSARPARADVPFVGQPPITTASDSPRSVVAADMDGDGDVDVLSASSGDNKVAWYENAVGDGSVWITRTITTAALGASSVLTADVDGDGDTDALAALLFGDAVVWYENTTGNGSAWKARTITTAAPGAASVCAADVDGDGDTDALTALLSGNAVTWYENTAGNGSAWTARTITTVAPGAASVFAADVDGDGDTDALSASLADDRVAWYENTAGNGSAWTTRTVTTAALEAADVKAADVDGDGDTDVLAASRLDDKIAWYENTAGNGSAWAVRTISTAADLASSVFAADVDGDGDADVLSASENDDKVAWYENVAGNGSVWTVRTLSTAAAEASAVFAADVDGDGDTDVLSASVADDRLAWYRNETIHASACFVTRTPVSTVTLSAQDVLAADVDGNGDVDLISASSGDDKVAWYQNLLGDGTAWATRTISIAADGSRSVFAADVDGDGDLDALSASNIDNKVAWYQNLAGDGSAWATRTISTGAQNAHFVHAADVDSDGDVDALSASGIDDKVAWYENTAGNGTAWSTHTITTAAISARAVLAADVDRDGDTDVLSVSLSLKVAWHENTAGNGTAWTTHTLTSGLVFGLAAGDLDGDGDTDVVTALDNNRLAWFENIANGSAWNVHTIATVMPNDVDDVFAADVDGDGDADVLATFAFTDRISWYENTAGNGSAWTAHGLTTATNGPLAMRTADLDGDGRQDVVSASIADNTVAWYRNGGGHVSLAVSDTAPPTANNGELVSMLRVDVTHLGRAGDHDLELSSLGLLLEEAAGDPLTTSEASALVESLRVYRDADGNGVFEPATDVLVTSVTTLSLVGGVQTVPLADGDANVQVAFGSPRTFFVVVELTANASQQLPNRLRITHLGLGAFASVAQDRDFDLPLRLGCPANASSSIKQAVPVELMQFTVE